MAEVFTNIKYEYSYSGGKYWSPYDHCRVWKNGTYELQVRDNYGKMATRSIEITNNLTEELVLTVGTMTFKDANGAEIPYRTGMYFYTANPVVLTINTTEDAKLKTRQPGQNWVETSFVNGSATIDITNPIELYAEDKYGRKSEVSTISATKVNDTDFAPSVKAELVNKAYLRTEAVEKKKLQAQPVKYSISYDNGKTWSSYQYGRKFEWANPPKGTYIIKLRERNTINQVGETGSTTIIVS